MAPGPRTRTVETITKEEVPVSESQGLGMSPLEWLATCSDDDLAISNVKFYRYDQGPPGRFLEKLEPAQRVDEDWMGKRYGGGIYGVRVYCKNGKGGFDKNVPIDPILFGPAKSPGAASLAPANGIQPAAAAPPSSTDATMNRILDMLEKTNERVQQLAERQSHPAAPQSNPAQDSVVSMMAEGAKAAIGLVASQIKQPEAPKGGLFDDLEKIKSLRDLFAPPATAIVKPPTLEEELAKLKALKDLFQPAPAVSLADELAKFKTLKDLFADSGGGGGKADWKSALIEVIGERVPDIVNAAKDMMQAKARSDAAASAAVQARAAAAVAVSQRAGIPPAPPRLAPQPIPFTPAAGAAPTSAQPAPPPPAAGPAEWGGPLDIVGAGEAAPGAELTPEAQAVVESQEAVVVDQYLKRRVLTLITEKADPAMVLDFIDGAAPQIGAMLTSATEDQIRGFLASDPILVEVTRLPHFEAYLQDLMAVLEEEGGEPDEEEPPKPALPGKVN